jgi:pimeloyl-ACP methyl ester carboxylesterase
MIALMSKYQVAAIDLRGYNLSDKPQGEEYYLILHLVSDIQAVIRHLEKDKAIIMTDICQRQRRIVIIV